MNYLHERIRSLTNSEIKDIEIDAFKEVICPYRNVSLFFKGNLSHSEYNKVLRKSGSDLID